MTDPRDRHPLVFGFALAMALFGVAAMGWLICQGAAMLGELALWFVRS